MVITTINNNFMICHVYNNMLAALQYLTGNYRACLKRSMMVLIQPAGVTHLIGILYPGLTMAITFFPIPDKIIH